MVCSNGKLVLPQCVEGASGALVRTSPLPNVAENQVAKALNFPAFDTEKDNDARNGRKDSSTEQV